MYTCMYVCMYIRMCMYYECMHVCMNVCKYVCIYVCMCILYTYYNGTLSSHTAQTASTLCMIKTGDLDELQD